MDLGQAFRKLFKDIDNASQSIHKFENETIPSLNAEIQSQKKIILDKNAQLTNTQTKYNDLLDKS
jgi:hypothetical protein